MTILVKEAVKEKPIASLETVLLQMDGTERALVDIENGEVKIEYNEHRISEEQIKQSIIQHGFHLAE